eukprot:3994550-Pleurochrysis_carterae.AAC.4
MRHALPCRALVKTAGAMSCVRGCRHRSAHPHYELRCATMRQACLLCEDMFQQRMELDQLVCPLR